MKGSALRFVVLDDCVKVGYVAGALERDRKRGDVHRDRGYGDRRDRPIKVSSVDTSERLAQPFKLTYSVSRAFGAD
jgi:hypothetical protein